MKRLANNDRGEVGGPEFVMVMFIIAVIAWGAHAHLRKSNDDRWVERVEDRYGVTLVGDYEVKRGVGDVTKTSVKLDGDILTCDVLTETVGFTVTCDSPDGRITLKEK